MMYNIGLICYKCGSDRIEFLKENSDTVIYRCRDCGKVIIRGKEGKARWIDYKKN